MKKIALFPLVAILLGTVRPARPAESARWLRIGRAARVLDGISKKAQNAVPDAVLNSTKCIVVYPSIRGGPANVSVGGVASCREESNHWSTPTFVDFKGHGIRGPGTNLLIFILGDTGVRDLRSGGLKITAPKGAAPLVRTTPVTTQVELTTGVLAYEATAGVLSSSKADPMLAPDTSDPARNALRKKTIENYQRSVVSFFNTIIATGIVIHHTSVIPGEKAAPQNERQVDKYHQSRGFEILCFGHVHHMAYHYLIMPNGSVHAGRPERCEGAHAKGYNSYLGISVVGDFSSEDNPTGRKGPTRPSAKQLASLIQLCRRLKDRYNIPLQHIVRHSDISSTTCPGDRFPFTSVLRRIQQRPSSVKRRHR